MDEEKPSLWQQLKPKVVDAGIIGAGVGAGAGLGAIGAHVLKNHTNIGQLWDKLPPSTRMKILIPATAGLGATTLALSAIRDTYRHKEETPKKPMEVIITEDRTKTASLGDLPLSAITGGLAGGFAAAKESDGNHTLLKTLAGAGAGGAVGLLSHKYVTPRALNFVENQYRHGVSNYPLRLGLMTAGVVVPALLPSVAGHYTGKAVSKLTNSEKTASIENLGRILAQLSFDMDKTAENHNSNVLLKGTAGGTAVGGLVGAKAGVHIADHFASKAHNAALNEAESILSHSEHMHPVDFEKVLGAHNEVNNLLSGARKRYMKSLGGGAIAGGTVGALGGGALAYHLLKKKSKNDQST